MKRAEALQPISREHHQALYLALQLRRAERAPDGARLFLEFWREAGREHFRVEEELLLPLWARLGARGPAPEQVARLASEHLELRSAVLALEDREPDLAEVHELGERLEAHVRFEERELFPALEADLGPEGLARLGRAIADAPDAR